ncbi:hypothetical protein JCM10207_003028 [Rhodosporidiobolus poonsookiae]
MSYGYGAPSTPPRNRTSRATSVSAGAPSSTLSSLHNRTSPRKKLQRAGQNHGYGASDGGRSREQQKRREQLGRKAARLRQSVFARWKKLLVGALLVAVALYWVLHEPERPPLIIPKRPRSPQTYRHLDLSAPITLRPATRILHVTKEFGPATMGGLGAMLTALSIAQSESPYLSISVALPHYSYLRERYTAGEIQPFATLSIPFTSNPTSPSRAKTQHVHCPVSLLRWSYSTAPDFLDPDSPLLSAAQDASLARTIDVYLIGPSDSKPFSAAFRAKDEGDIYSAYKPLKQEWKDLYFARAAAELVSYLGAKDETTVFEDAAMGAFDLDEDDENELEARAVQKKASARRKVDVVHLHGATNAMVAHFLREREREHRHDEPSGRHPAIVYTLHDSLDEVEYSNLVSNVVHFLPPASPAAQTSSSLSRVEPYIYRSSTQLFTSALGIDLADAVTFVSRSIAADIVSGQFRFHLEDLVMPSIAKRAASGHFIGVTNGLDFTEQTKNPFTAPSLVERGLSFPRVGENILDETTLWTAQRTRASFLETKQRAKAHLVWQLPTLFPHPADASRPWFLFIGRYQYNKGCQLFSTLLAALSTPSPALPHGGRLVLVGARNNYPFAALQALARQYLHHLTLIDDRDTPGVQAQWGTLLRMASDVAVVPSLSEAFGLVAAEGLLFGMPVLSTGVGGLREFLVPFSPEDAAVSARGNAYLFDLFPQRSTPATQGAEDDYSQPAHDVRPGEAQLAPARVQLRKVTERAMRDWAARADAEWEDAETFTRRMVADALRLKWNREQGPVEEYVRVYDLALTTRRRRLGLPLHIPSPPSAHSTHDDHPSHPRARRPPPFLVPPLRNAVEHPVAVPHIAQGGHDTVSGADGLANLLVEREMELENLALEREQAEMARREAEEAAAERDGRATGGGDGQAGGVLPIVKVWASDSDRKAKLALAQAMGKKKRTQQGQKAKGVAAQAHKKKALQKTIKKVAKRKGE